MKSLVKKIVIFIVAVGILALTAPLLFLIMLLPSAEIDQANQYKTVAEATNLNWADMIIFDTVRYENDFSNADPNATVWEFILVNFQEQEFVENDQGGGYWSTVRSGLLQNKTQILNFINRNLARYFSERELRLADSNSFTDVMDVLNRVNNREVRVQSGYTDPIKNVRFIIDKASKDLEDVMMEHGFTDEQKEWVDMLVEEQYVYQMYGEMFDLPEHIPINIGNFFAWPTPTLHTVTSPFGWRIHPVDGTRRFHYGVDIAGPNANGQPIIASADGEVTQVVFSNGAAGYYVRIKHFDDDGNLWETRYLHMSRITARVGQYVRQGDVIGSVGNTGVGTGAHLHFEILFEGQALDPMSYFQR